MPNERRFIIMKIDSTYQHVVLGGQRSGLVGAEVVEIVGLTGQGSLHMVDDGFCDRGSVWVFKSVNHGDMENDPDPGTEQAWEGLPLSTALRPSFHTFSSPRGHFSFPVSSTSAK